MVLLLDWNTHGTLLSILDTPKEGGDTSEESRGAIRIVKGLKNI